MTHYRKFFGRIVWHLSLMFVTGVCVVGLFFQYILPILTYHGQYITVPYLKGMSLEEADVYLTQRNLRLEISEETFYEPDYLPMTVLQQHPQAGTQVKSKRKIYLTINTKNPPKVVMPHLVDGSIRNAYLRLKSRGLLLGTIKYVPDVAHMAVLEQWCQGQEISAGTLLDQGTKVDLVVGAGLGDELVTVPSLVGIKFIDAKSLLLARGLQIGNVAHQDTIQQPSGTILRQHPAAGATVRIGEHVDIWLVTMSKAPASPDTPMLSGHPSEHH